MNHLVVAEVFIVVTSTATIVHIRFIRFSCNHLALRRHSLLLYILLLNGLDILVLTLYLLLHGYLVIRGATAHDFLRDCGSCDEISLQEQLRSLQSISKGSLRVFAVENVPEFVRKLAIGHQNVLPLGERENSFVR